MIFVGGAPVPFIGKLGGKLHFVRLPTNPALEQIYLRTSLGKQLYGWAGADTETYAVPAVILGLDKRDEKYVMQMQQLVLAILNRAGVARGQWSSEVEERHYSNLLSR